MKLAITANDRTYSIHLPWWFLLAALLSAVLWQPAAAWASHTFSDVPTSHTFHGDIEWMARSGVTKGCGGDRFCPDDYVTRAQMAAFMHRFESNVASTGDGSDPAVESRLTSLESKVATLESRNEALESLLAGVSRKGNRLLFTGMNLQVVNGSGTTNGTPNGLGNLIIGYDKARSSGSAKTGSHYLVVGDEHNYTKYGGLVVGYRNTASGNYASVAGGTNNTASGSSASVSGGASNTASGSRASVSGGATNTASGTYASVSGGDTNTASGSRASVSGGSQNNAANNWASVSGGAGNTASEDYASVSGGYLNAASGSYASVSGGTGNTASGSFASVSGGAGNTASGSNASILGGNTTTVSATDGCHPSCV